VRSALVSLFVQVGHGAQVVGEARIHRHQLVGVIAQRRDVALRRRLDGEAITEPDQRGERIRDDSFLLLFNASEQDLEFAVPSARYGQAWEKELDTAAPGSANAAAIKPGDMLKVRNRSIQVLRRAVPAGSSQP